MTVPADSLGFQGVWGFGVCGISFEMGLLKFRCVFLLGESVRDSAIHHNGIEILGSNEDY